jgi:hypothetical protein
MISVDILGLFVDETLIYVDNCITYVDILKNNPHSQHDC